MHLIKPGHHFEKLRNWNGTSLLANKTAIVDRVFCSKSYIRRVILNPTQVDFHCRLSTEFYALSIVNYRTGITTAWESLRTTTFCPLPIQAKP